MNDIKTEFIAWLQKERYNQFSKLFSEDVLVNLESQNQISKLEKISRNNFQNLNDSGSTIQFHKVIKSNVQEFNQRNKFKQKQEQDYIDNIQFCPNTFDQNDRVDLSNFQKTYTKKQPKQEFLKEEIPLRKLIAILK